MPVVLPAATATTVEPSRARRPVVPIICAAAGGALTSMAFPDLGWWPVAFVGLAALSLACRRLGAGATSLAWFAWALALFLPHLSWTREAAGPSAWVALAVLEATVVAVAGAAWALARRAAFLDRFPGLRAVAFAAVWVTGEHLRSVVPFGGFPWGRLAFSQVDGPLLPIASVAGAPGVSFAVALGGYALSGAVVAARRRELRRAAAVIAATVVAALAPGALMALPTEPESGELNLGAVQGNVPELAGPGRAHQVLENHVSGTRQLDESRSEPLDLVVWPENATDIDPRTDQGAAAQVRAAAESVGAPVLLGAMRYAPGARYNDVLVWDPERGPTASYSKQRPAPFGEYIPLRPFVRMLSTEVDRVPVDMVAGQKPALLPVPSTRLGRDVLAATVICFEVAYDDVVRDAVTRGAEILLVPTNNASFGRTAQSTQQLAMSRLRAVEHGRATVQISTVGVSAIIAPDGTVLNRTKLFTEGVMAARLPLRTTLTTSDRLGGVPTVLAAALAFAAVLGGATPRARLRVPKIDRRHRSERWGIARSRACS
ncbi:apolipoprotein N-acyltransferase [Cellulomonas sp. ES6]|uniref:apolipoprotein N-acyltransferase n=1 Tax=Cellulomonas sp. ES6 TaxID=3039384 RepID=UPI0024B63EAE|nr:apolipoprotein N-acyltransferase [Cellulomonas sp. ES6]WHP16576.1 apolipoprotein N-acyltransferase [Cellulomonas sp. ES6]